MATAATRKSIIDLVVLATGGAPGTTKLGELIVLSDSGKTLAEIADMLVAEASFTAVYPTFATNAEFAAEYIANALPAATAEVRTQSADLVVTYMNAGLTKAQILRATTDFLAAVATDEVSYGSSAVLFQNKVAVATFHTITLELDTNLTGALVGVTVEPTSVTAAEASLGAGASAGGTTVSLTTGIDAIVGGAGDDVVNAAAGTLILGDTINGGDGIDTLNLTGTGALPNQTASTLAAVEIVNLTANPNPLSVSMLGVTGVTDINNLNSANGATVTVSNVGAPVNSTLTGGQAATTIGYATAVTAATAVTDASTLTLAGTALGASYTATGIELVTVNSTTAANTLLALGVASATKVTVTGDQALTINGTVGGTALTAVDASAFTGTTLSLATGSGTSAATDIVGVAVTLPTAATVTSTLTTSTNIDTITLGAGNATVVAGAGNDTINAGAGTNTLTGGTGNDAIKLTGTKDTVLYSESGAANADTITGFTTTSVLSVDLGTAATTTVAAVADANFGTVQTGATSPSLGNVDGTGTGTAIVFQAVSPTATAAVGSAVAAGSNVLALNGAFTDGTVGGVITALGNSATTAIATVAASKFLIATYSVGNIAQVWAYTGDANADTNITAAELALVATISGVAQNSLTAANFSAFLAAGTATAGTVSNAGQTIDVVTPLNLINSTSNANGDFLTAADDTITVAQGMLPTAATTTTGLTVIDPEGANDADVLTATVLSGDWDLGTLISNVETVNLNFLAPGPFAMSSILPGTDTLNISGLASSGAITNVLTGTAIGIGAAYAQTVTVTTPVVAALSLNLNGNSFTTAATAPTFTTTNAITALTINANASSSLNTVTNAGTLTAVTLAGAGNVTIFDAAAGIIAANITAPAATYTGTFTLVPDAANTGFDLSNAGSDVVGLDVFDISIADNAANTITLPAVATGGTLTVKHAPTGSATTGAGNALTVVQSGTSTADKLTLALGANSTGTGTGNIVAATTDTLTITSAAATGITTTVAAVTLATGTATQSVTVTAAGNFVATGAVNADTVSTAGVTGTVNIANLSNAVGSTTFTGGAGATTIGGAGAANVSVTTGIGNDVITTGTGDDIIVTGEGTSTVVTGDGTNSVTGGSGVDNITGGDDVDTIVAGNGNNIITGGNGADALTGGTGDDTFVVAANGDIDTGDRKSVV